MSVRLLYVEDDDDLRAMVLVLLRREGYDVTAVSSAEDAIVELQRGKFQLLLTDYNLPNKNASWMLQVARDAGWLNNVQVVVMSATIDPGGIADFRILRKPVDVSVLFVALEEAVAALEKPFEGACEAAPWDGKSVVLILYVTGTSRESKKAVRNLQRVIQKFDTGLVRLTVCDVTELPEGGTTTLDDDRVVVTPTLVRRYPPPKLWIFGDLSRDEPVEEMIASGLELAKGEVSGHLYTG